MNKGEDTLREEFDKKTKEDFFPGGGDSHDFDKDACFKWINENYISKEVCHVRQEEWYIKGKNFMLSHIRQTLDAEFTDID